MYPSIFIALFVLTNIACQSPQAQTANNSVENKLPAMSNASINSQDEQSNKNSKEIIETFSEDKNIGAYGKNKIEISEFEAAEFYKVELKFYSLDKSKNWKLKQTIEMDSGASNPEVQLKDFNNDGFKDVTYVSEIAARGANEIRRLFIYDKAKDELIYIKNSEDYPNLLYNKTLNCLDAQRFYGGTTTDFLKIESDTLKEFASVETVGIERKVYSVDKNGARKILRTDKISKDELFERYKTFNPPQIYTAKELKQ